MVSSFPLLAYRCATVALTPVVPLALKSRASRGKEDLSRIRERLGYAGKPRPDGTLIWVHGASVGECISVLPLIGELLKTEARHVLVTSGTVTSAELMSERLPAGAFHQYAPVDIPSAIRRFLDHWRPDSGLFVDSEIWPNMISAARKRDIPLALINGRMSAASFARWRRVQKTASALLGKYDLCLAQDLETAERLSALGAPKVQVSGNLKADAPPLAADPEKLLQLKEAIGGRPVLLAASTHPGEAETLLPAHDKLRRAYPRLLTIIAPRHPERGGEIAMLCGGRRSVQRSNGALPGEDSDIYVADTLGEFGLLYRAAPFAFIGGSLVPHGGQNPLEAARLGCAVMAGPDTHNFRSAYEAIFVAQGEGLVTTSTDIAALAQKWMEDPAAASAMGRAAAQAAESLSGATERTLASIESLLAHALA
ncbi:MAG TPA: 3-deoxy-D-manno-octulosonic acid transferase [Rhizomicrobium sp.]|nr:3-deoxy-D-manno-octulosonic acid transferase [Rhizomicrobium sp.]